MRLFDLQVFLSVLDIGSLAGAARIHHFTQPTVSNIIQSLESEVGATLLLRSPGQRNCVEATPAGRTFAEYARDAVARYQSMRLAIAESNSEDLSLSVIASPTPGTSVLPMLVSQFRAEYAQIVISSTTSVSFLNHVLRSIKEGDYDIGITPNITSNKELLFEPFFYDPIIPVCSTQLGLKQTITLKEFQRLPIVCRPTESKNMQRVIHTLAAAHVDFSSLHISIQVNGDADVLRAVASVNGIGFVTRSLYEGTSPNHHIMPLHINGLQVDRYLYLVRRKDKRPSTAAKIFHDYAMSAQWRKSFQYDTIPSIRAEHKFL